MMKCRIFITLLLSAIFLAPVAQAKTNPSWIKTCDNKDSECLIVHSIVVNQKDKDGKTQSLGKILGVQVQKITSAQGQIQPVMALDLPLGVDLQVGIVLKIDDNDEFYASFQQCQDYGCRSVIKLTKKQLKSLKAGKKLFVGFRPFGVQQTNVLEVSLSGFTKSYNGL